MLTSVTFEAMSGYLDVTLENGDDVSIQASGGQVQVLVNGTQAGPAPNASEVWSINVHGDEGDNAIDLSGVTSADFTGSPVIDVWENGGDDTVTDSELGHNLNDDDSDSDSDSLVDILANYQVDESPQTTFDPGFPYNLIVDPVSVTEAELALLEELSALELYELSDIKDDAYEESQERFNGQGGEDGHQDAFRHAYASVLLALRFGEEFAESFTTAHETGVNNPADREAMDLYNNEVGRRIARENPSATLAELADLVFEAIENGEMIVIDENNELAWSDDVELGETGEADDEPVQTDNQVPDVPTTST